MVLAQATDLDIWRDWIASAALLWNQKAEKTAPVSVGVQLPLPSLSALAAERDCNHQKLNTDYILFQKVDWNRQRIKSWFYSFPEGRLEPPEN